MKSHRGSYASHCPPAHVPSFFICLRCSYISHAAPSHPHSFPSPTTTIDWYLGQLVALHTPFPFASALLPSFQPFALLIQTSPLSFASCFSNAISISPHNRVTSNSCVHQHPSTFFPVNHQLRQLPPTYPQSFQRASNHSQYNYISSSGSQLDTLFFKNLDRRQPTCISQLPSSWHLPLLFLHTLQRAALSQSTISMAMGLS